MYNISTDELYNNFTDEMNNNSDCVNDVFHKENLDCTLDQLPDWNDFLAKLKADQIPKPLPWDEIDHD
jgi:hypothetical protein